MWGASLPAAAPHCPHLGTSGLGAGWLAGRLAGWLACLLSQLDVSARQPRVRGPGLERIEDCAEVHHQISRLFTSHLHQALVLRAGRITRPAGLDNDPLPR